MAEFKKLSDVEVVAEPMESANVLIEENGVIKKAPKTAVGGNDVFDAKIYLDGGFDPNQSIITLLEGNFTTIKTRLDNKEMPFISIYWNKDMSGSFVEFCTISRFIFEYEGALMILFMDFNLNPWTLILLPDNTFYQNTVS